MKIRDKLFLGFGLYVFLAIVLGFFAYQELSTINKRFRLVEMADDITNTLLEARRQEKNYLLFRDEKSFGEFKEQIDRLTGYIDNIQSEIIHTIGIGKYGTMKETILKYKNLLISLKNNFDNQNALMDSVRKNGRAVERRLFGKGLEKFLVLRRHEKNLLLYKDKESYSIVMKGLSASGFYSASDIKHYKNSIEKLFSLFEQERETLERMRLKAREVQTFTESISKKERADIDAIGKMSIKLLVIALILIIIAGFIVNMKLAISIANPLRKLEKITRKISEGDFSENLNVSGNDEIASLGTSFNKMEENLKNTMQSLEAAIQRLHEKQSQLVEAEKLASVGILAAGIAHEINNPLTSVLTFSNLMIEQMPKDDPRYEKLKMMARETERARNIVRQLLSFSRETPLKKAPININMPVSEIIDSLNAQGLFKQIELRLNLADNLPEVNADPARIGQVVMNLMLNAVHSITPPGIIEVSTKAADNHIAIIFSDTGCGISEENIHKLFDPFFTTKDVNKGTGLGLAVSYGIIKKHGGSIDVNSEHGKGSTFTVKLPLADSGIIE